MASKLALALVIGGAVASSVGAAFNTVEGRIKKLEEKGNKAKVLKSTIGETQKLQAEWKRAHEAGAAGADKLLRKLEGNLGALRKQGIEVGRLGQEYKRLAREAKAADLQVKGHQQLNAGKSALKTNMGAAAVGVGLTAIPTKISADYQAIIRDIAIKADAVNTPQEVQLNRSVINTANETGMSRNDAADLINQLVGAGMDLDKAMAYAPTAAKFAVGQSASGVDTASMIMALQQNAKITDPKVMQQALEAIAYQGQAGSFEASDMAKWFPQLLASMEKNGSTGLDAVTSLGSMLQVQMKTAGSSDEAANNFKNWVEKIGSGDVVKAYADVGIDYQKSLNTGIQKGMSSIESSMALAMRYVEATDPAKAKTIREAKAKISSEVDPVKAQAALDALEKSLRTGDLFADMQVKAALTAYSQNKELYEQLKNDSKKSSGILDKNLAERRETSSQRWKEMAQSADDAMRSIGDAIRPVTDAAALGLTWMAQGITTLTDKFPGVVMGIGGVVVAIGALITAASALKVGRGAYNIARGSLMGRRPGRERAGAAGGGSAPRAGSRVANAGLGVLGQLMGLPASNDGAPGVSSEPQRVFVVNAAAMGGGGASGAGMGAGERQRPRRGRRGRRRGAASLGAAQPTPKAPPVAMPAPVAKAAPVPHAMPAAQLKSAGVASLVADAAASADTKSLGQTVRSMRGVTKGLSKVPGGKLLDVVPGVLDTALNAQTQNEKAEGYGGVAGGAAGAWAGGVSGAMAGAAIGSIVPGIGTAVGGAVGGAIGAVLGGLGGESLGGWLGKKVFGEDEPAVAKAPPAPTPGDAVREIAKAAPPAPAPGDVVRDMAKAAPPVPSAPELAKAAAPKAAPPKVDQAFTYSPTSTITVQGDVKDPAQLARDLEPHTRAQFEAWWREMQARQGATQLFDQAHVA